jgi:hypothetical protein
MPVWSEPRHNPTATTDPTSTDDITQGYAAGSTWVNTTTGVSFNCTDATESAAVWSSSTTGSATLATSWRFSSTTTASDPGSKTFRLDNATQGSATNVYFNITAESGVDAGNVLMSLENGDRIYVQEAGDSTRYHLLALSGAVTDNTGWMTVPVTVEDSGLDIQNGRLCSMIFLFSAGAAGGGEANLGQNVGTAGVGVFKQKSGVTLQFKQINAGSNKVTITDDTGNDEIDIDVAEANIDHDALTNFVANEHLDWTQSVGTIHTDNYIEGGPGTDTTAIHDDTAGEIAAVAEKTTPVGADLVLIEDSEATNAKKRLQLSNLVTLAPSLDTYRWVLNGKPIVETGIDNAWIAPRAGTITRITLYRRTEGGGGSLIVDVNKNGTTLYTTQGNRPTVTAAGGANQIDVTTDFDVTTFAQDDRFEVDVDQIETGNPQDIAVIMEVQYS